MSRKSEITKIFDNIEQKELIKPLIDEVVFLETELERLRAFPFIKVHPKHPEIQKRTPAAKQYKENLQSYVSAIRTLQSFLKNSEEDAAAALMEKLKEFE